jgi:hypothetical protein
MRRPVVFLVMVVGCFGGSDADAMFILYQTQQVPIARLFTNLQQRLARDTNDFQLTYNLARLHSMAYSTNLVSLSVRTNDQPEFYSPGSDSGVPRGVYPAQSPEARAQALRHLTNAILLYERAILLLKKSTNEIEYKAWLVLPLELGYSWCLDQAGRRNEALAAYRKTLALAWKREVVGEFSFKEWVQGKWDAIKSGSNPLRKTTGRSYIGPGVCYSQESIGYLLKLLDPVKDAKEIADLQDKKKTLQSMGRAITPILVPIGAETGLEELVDSDAGVTFDLDGSGLPRQWGWITPKATWLVFDADGQGRISSALQMFGNVTFWIFWSDGYEALRALDDDNDGKLCGAELRGIALWHDRNGNGVSDQGEVRPVAEWGIAAISCVSQAHSAGITWCPRGVTFANGKTRPTYDWINASRCEQK